MSVGVRECRARLSELLDQAETIAITRNGKEVARLVPPEPKFERRPGRMKGQIWYAPDWMETPEDLIDLMEGKDEGWRDCCSTPMPFSGGSMISHNLAATRAMRSKRQTS